jgi:hypothetical protein
MHALLPWAFPQGDDAEFGRPNIVTIIIAFFYSALCLVIHSFVVL